MLDDFQDLLQVLHRPNEDMLDEPGSLLLKAFYQMNYKAAGLSPDADVSFQAMLLFCVVVPATMKQQASLVLDETQTHRYISSLKPMITCCQLNAVF